MFLSCDWDEVKLLDNAGFGAIDGGWDFSRALHRACGGAIEPWQEKRERGNLRRKDREAVAAMVSGVMAGVVARVDGPAAPPTAMDLTYRSTSHLNRGEATGVH